MSVARAVIRLKGGPTSGWYAPGKGTHTGAAHIEAGSGKTGAGYVGGKKVIAGGITNRRGRVDTADVSVRDMDAKGSEFLQKRSGTDISWSNLDAHYNKEELGAVKDRIVNGILNDLGVTGPNRDAAYQEVNDILHQWANTSNDTDMRSLDIQERASRLFGSDMSQWQKSQIAGIEAGHVSFANRERLDASHIDGNVRSVLKTVYDRTQRELAAGGIDSITLYRGTRLPTEARKTAMFGGKVTTATPGYVSRIYVTDYTNAKVKGNSLESWSVDPGVAHSFIGGSQTGVVLRMNVPRELIFSTAVTGMGCLNEGEFIIFGGYEGEATLYAE